MLKAVGTPVTVKVRSEFGGAPAERSGDGALNDSELDNPKRCRAPLATALQIKSTGCAGLSLPLQSSNALAASDRCSEDES